MDKIEYLDVGDRTVELTWARGEKKSAQDMRRQLGQDSRGRYGRDRSPPRRRYVFVKLLIFKKILAIAQTL